MSEKKRISIDPITRIEGHLRIDCEIENGVVTNAWSSGTFVNSADRRTCTCSRIASIFSKRQENFRLRS